MQARYEHVHRLIQMEKTMDMVNGHTGNITVNTYEYRTVVVPEQRISLTRDTYEAFGWFEDGMAPSDPSFGTVNLRLKRNRRIRNRSMINELQRKAEAALSDIDHLERSKTQKAQIVSFSVGIVACAFLAGAIFSMMASLWVPFVLFGFIGLAGWVAPYLVFTKIKAKQIAKATPQIDQRYDTIYDACEQVQRLMSQQ